MSSTLTYREDIDGLRAIAVSSVVLYHFGIAGFGGGYVGVDIFFAISGYLIGSIVFAQLGKNKFSFSNFYIRRIRRLFPASFVMTVLTFLVGYRLLLPTEFREFGQSVVATTTYMSNILFYMKAGYFDTASHMKPLLHTWSLSAEEQFYLIFPLAAWLCYRFAQKYAVAFFTLACVASLTAAAIYIHKDQSAVFYLYPFRAWEMFIGVVVGVSKVSYGKLNTSKVASNVLAAAGLLLTCYPIFCYTKDTQFPGLAALSPCVGTLMLILSGANQANWVSRLLSTSPFVFIGKISYSMYLWHWPIFVLYTYASMRDPNLQDSIILLAATFVASVISWKYIEQPFREPATSGHEKLKTFGATAIASALAIGLGLYIYKTDGMPNRLDADTAKIAAVSNDFLRDWSGCVGEENPILPGLKHCVVGDPYHSDNVLLVWGDSHAAAYRAGINEAARNAQQDVLVVWRTGCPPVWGLTKEESANTTQENLDCTPHNDKVLELLNQNKNIKAVILVGRWAYYLNGAGVGTDGEHLIKLSTKNSSGDQAKPADLFMAAFDSTLQLLEQHHLKIFVMEQVPEFSQYNSSKLARELKVGKADANQITASAIEPYSAVLDRQQIIQNYLNTAEQQQKLNVIRTHSLFCQKENCSLMVNGLPAYFDNNHVTTTASVFMQTVYKPALDYMSSIKSNVK